MQVVDQIPGLTKLLHLLPSCLLEMNVDANANSRIYHAHAGAGRGREPRNGKTGEGEEET